MLYYVGGIIPYVAFCVWLFWVSMRLSKVCPCSSRCQDFISFCGKYYTIVWIDHILCIHLLIDRYLKHFYLWSIMNNTPVDLHIQVFCIDMYFQFPWCILGMELLSCVYN